MKKLGVRTSSLLAVAAVAVFAAGCGESSSSSSGGNKEKSDDGPLVQGTWGGGCNQYSGGDYSACKAVRVKSVTCHWSGDDVYVTVVFKNTFGAHVTVHFQPIYVLRNAGKHGTGLTSSQDVGLDPGERQEYAAKQEPKGVKGRPKITKCAPKFDDILGVELG